MAAELQKGSPPDRAVGFVRVNSQVMRFVGDGQQQLRVPAAEFGFQVILLASCALVAEQPTIRLV